jgi:hypothetical protein
MHWQHATAAWQLPPLHLEHRQGGDIDGRQHLVGCSHHICQLGLALRLGQAVIPAQPPTDAWV